MSNIIDITLIYEHDQVSIDSLQVFTEQVLVALGVDECELSLLITDDAAIQELNRVYRGKDEPTDVLSFAQCDDDSFPDPEGEGDFEILGDIIISIDTLQRNAEYFTVPFKQELQRVIIHGILHLLGEDHKTNDPVEEMLIKQESLVLRLQEFDIS